MSYMLSQYCVIVISDVLGAFVGILSKLGYHMPPFLEFFGVIMAPKQRISSVAQ